MRIGILTLPLHSNYGGNLQAYALMTVLRDMGHEPCLIQRKEKPFPRWRVAPALLKRSILKYVFRRRSVNISAGIFDGKERARVEQHARRFIATHIQPQTRKVTSFEELKQEVENRQFDAVIVGSDQVWRSRYAPSIEENFLSFLAPGSTTRRISYAASFGTDEWQFSAAEEKTCGELLRRFDAVSVREASAVALCESRFGVTAEHVLDPTMLLDTERYLALLPDTPSRPTGKRSLLVYFLDEDVDRSSVVTAICNALGLEANRVNAIGRDGAAPSVEAWIAGFRDADFVITDSFHACVFAILFKRPFIAYGNLKRGLARFESLLDMFSLRRRLISSPAQASHDLINDAIDWERVHEALHRHRERSRSFLVTALAPDSERPRK